MDKYLIDPKTGCWNWTGSKGMDGRARIKINGVTTHPARIFWELYIGSIPDKALVCHHCDNTLCVNPDHLFLGTHRDNTEDMVSKGRHGNMKLTAAQVLAIRSDTRKACVIAKEYAISHFTVYGIRNGWNRPKLFPLKENQLGKQ